jgi:hypothetical protein
VGLPLPYKFEDDHPSIIAISEQVEGGVVSTHPKLVILPLCTQVLLLMSQTLIDLSLLLKKISSCPGWKIMQDTLL